MLFSLGLCCLNNLVTFIVFQLNMIDVFQLQCAKDNTHHYYSMTCSKPRKGVATGDNIVHYTETLKKDDQKTSNLPLLEMTYLHIKDCIFK